MDVVLCAVTDDDNARDAVAITRRLAEGGALEPLFVHVAPMVVPTVVPPSTAYGLPPGVVGASMAVPPDTVDELRKSALDAGTALLRRLGIGEDESRVVVGDVVAELCRAAEELDPDLVVVGSRGRGALSAAILGSVSRALVDEARWPVVVARPGMAGASGESVVCGLEEPAEDACVVARSAAALADALDMGVVLAHVVPDGSEATVAGTIAGAYLPALDDQDHAAAQDLLDRVCDVIPGRRDVQRVVVAGSPAERLAAAADELDAQAVVVGHHLAGALRSALGGSVSLSLIREGRWPVVVVPLR